MREDRSITSFELKREFRRYLQLVRGKRTRNERWNTLNDRIAAYERTQYGWVAPEMSWNDVYRESLVMNLWTLSPRFIGRW